MSTRCRRDDAASHPLQHRPAMTRRMPRVEASLLPIVDELEKQHAIFTGARDMLLETQAALPTMSADDMEKAAGTLKTCSVHYEAFRNGALKEGSNLMK